MISASWCSCHCVILFPWEWDLWLAFNQKNMEKGMRGHHCGIMLYYIRKSCYQTCSRDSLPDWWSGNLGETHMANIFGQPEEAGAAARSWVKLLGTEEGLQLTTSKKLGPPDHNHKEINSANSLSELGSGFFSNWASTWEPAWLTPWLQFCEILSRACVWSFVTRQ